jgi:hypothetical protein
MPGGMSKPERTAWRIAETKRHRLAREYALYAPPEREDPPDRLAGYTKEARQLKDSTKTTSREEPKSKKKKHH